MSARTDEQVDAELDKSTIEHLDFEPTCQVRLEFVMIVHGRELSGGKAPWCENPAVALMRCRICRMEAHVCAAHRVSIASDVHAMCGRCKTRAHGSVLYDFLPLPGGTS